MSRQGLNSFVMIFKEHVPMENVPRKILDLIDEESYIELPTDVKEINHFWPTLRSAFI